MRPKAKDENAQVSRPQLGERASVEELLEIADGAATHLKRPYADHANLLYDENGLPK